MNASKFPVTYNGEEYRVTIAFWDGLYADEYNVRIYERRSGWLARLMPFRKVKESNWRTGCEDEGAIIVLAQNAVRNYVSARDEKRDKNALEAEAFRKFENWNGEV